MNNEEKMHTVDSLETIDNDNNDKMTVAFVGGGDTKPSYDLLNHIMEIETPEITSEDKKQSIDISTLMSSIYGWYGNELLDSAMRSIVRDSKNDKNILPIKRIEHIGNNSLICRGICPKCNSKLIRGKKDKKNEYKRTWKCKSCNIDFTMESE